MKLCLQISTVLLSVLTAWGDKNTERLLNLAGFSSSQGRNLEPNGFGTGFAVSPDGYLVSASHVTEGCDAVRVLFKKGEFLDARVVREEPQLDLAFLKVDIPTPSYLAVTNRTSSLGDDIYTIGYPSPQIMGFNQKFTRGSISALTGMRDSSFRYQISVPIQPGNSGGPVICEETGEVIGIVVSFLNDKVGFIPQNVNYALKSGFIKPIMESLELRQYSSYKNRSLNKNDRRKVAVDSTCLVVTYKFSKKSNLSPRSFIKPSRPQSNTSKPKYIDSTPPILDLKGDNPMVIKIGKKYVEPGVYADGGEEVVVQGEVNVDKEGKYVLEYSAKDLSGNVVKAKRTVNVRNQDAVGLRITFAETEHLRVSLGTYKVEVYIDEEYLGNVPGSNGGYFKFKGSGKRNLRVMHKKYTFFGDIEHHREVYNSDINLSAGLNKISIPVWR